MQEIFKDIPGYEKFYQVSNLGSVKSLGNNKKRKEKLLKAALNNKGYYTVSLSKDFKMKTIQVHQLVAMAFLNHKPHGHKIVVDHINNIKTDNRLENLQLISHRENASKDRKGYSSKYVGVHLCKIVNKWISRIYINGKTKHLGIFDNELLAKKAYQKALNELLKPN
jgi:hypothetical protein